MLKQSNKKQKVKQFFVRELGTVPPSNPDSTGKTSVSVATPSEDFASELFLSNQEIDQIHYAARAALNAGRSERVISDDGNAAAAVGASLRDNKGKAKPMRTTRRDFATAFCDNEDARHELEIKKLKLEKERLELECERLEIDRLKIQNDYEVNCRKVQDDYQLKKLQIKSKLVTDLLVAGMDIDRVQNVLHTFFSDSLL